jgi:amino acid transporter
MSVMTEAVGERTLHRTIDWKKTFWIASGVPPLVLFSIGGIAATVGTPSYIVWTLSILMGFAQSFTYAEIAGMFPNKSGGAPIYGAAAWIHYGKIFGPLSVWSYWLAWTPVLSIGTGIAAGYVLTGFFPATSPIQTWQWTIADLGFINQGLTLRINSTFFLGVVLLLLCFAIQHRGILRTAWFQTVVGVAVTVPLLIVAIWPIITGHVLTSNLTPLVPLGDANGAGYPFNGHWDKAGWGLFLGGMFIAAWSTYGFETAVCYTSELTNPGTDTFKAIFFSGILCLVLFILVPFTFQGALGVKAMLDPGIYDGSGVAKAMASMFGTAGVIYFVMVILLILALVLAIITAMAGSSRTLYQSSVDGWLPKYLSYVNPHGAPTRAMWTDLCFNVILLMMSNYLFVLAVSNCLYIIFNFINLNSGWLHRIDSGHVRRPWRAPNWLLGLGAVFSFVNMFFMGAGANIYGSNTLLLGIIGAALIIPIFIFRHYIQDHGKWPAKMLTDLGITEDMMHVRKAGMLPYLTIAAGALVVAAGWYYFWVVT